MTTTSRITLDTIADWMADHGRTCYVNMIEEVRCTMNEIEAEGGRYGKFCPFVQEQLAKCRAEIEDIQQSAYDRYQDWATD